MGNRKLKGKIHFSFIILFLWFIFTKNLNSFVVFCASVLTHEFGHYFVAKKLGYRLNNFCIAPYGVCLNYKEKAFEQKDEILIALAGPFVNFILSFIFIAIWWIAPEVYLFSYNFVQQSLILGLFNLLPCYPLDGGRVFVGLLSNYMSRKKAVKIAVCLNFVIAFSLMIMFIISFFVNFNPSFCLCGVFMIFSALDNKNECKYDAINVFNKKVKNYSKANILTVDENQSLKDILKHVEINKFSIFIVTFSNHKTKLLDEQAVKRFSLKYPLNTTMKEIFMQDKG